jgi:4-hydroxy-tetrahydrodipicolinate reductase
MLKSPNFSISGSTGKMGKEIIQTLLSINHIPKFLLDNPLSPFIDNNIGDLINIDSLNLKVTSNYQNAILNSDILIDFSQKDNTLNLLDFAYNNNQNIKFVIGTTGFNQQEEEKILLYSNKLTILKSANFSKGINIILKILNDYTKILYNNNYDIEILEKHHKNKVDSPSGTALLLSNKIKDTLKDTTKIVDKMRGFENNLKQKNEIGISSIRGGGIIGEHEVIFLDEKEVITISHQAIDRNIFAKTAVDLSFILLNKKHGLYNIADLL